MATRWAAWRSRRPRSGGRTSSAGTGSRASWGLESDLISPEECAEKIPLLDPDRIQGGFYVPSDGIAKAVRACEAMARLAGERGAKFYGETEVTGIEVKEGV